MYLKQVKIKLKKKRKKNHNLSSNQWNHLI